MDQQRQMPFAEQYKIFQTINRRNRTNEMIQECNKENIQFNNGQIQNRQQSRPPLQSNYDIINVDYNCQRDKSNLKIKPTLQAQNNLYEQQRHTNIDIHQGADSQPKKQLCLQKNSTTKNVNSLKRDFSYQILNTQRAQQNLHKELSFDKNNIQILTTQNDQRISSLPQTELNRNKLHIDPSPIHFNVSPYSEIPTQQTQRSYSQISRLNTNEKNMQKQFAPTANNDIKLRNPVQIKLNIKQFVKEVIKSQLFELTYKDQIFSQQLKRFINESNEFLANSEKHYRMKFIMDLVSALVSTMNKYISEQSNPDRIVLEKQALVKETEKFNHKRKKFKKCEKELKQRIVEFEEVFNILTELKTTYDKDKEQFIHGYFKKQNLNNSLNMQRQQMQQEDERSKLLRCFEQFNNKENIINQELIKLKQEQQKLQKDVQEFSTIKEQFEQYKQLKQEQFNQMQLRLQEKFQVLDKELQLKDVKLRKYDQDLRQREKVITDLILNNHETCQNQDLLKSFNRTLNLGEETYKTFDFDHFLGQFESHKDELIEREKAILTFLTKDDNTRQSVSSNFNLLKDSTQSNLLLRDLCDNKL